ncbi:MAG: arsenate reductase (glutaredoxin) [Porticoccaceae bacterium]|nr:arsenate reductase (glutaredoxin) [Porticoccaceae bacterium]
MITIYHNPRCSKSRQTLQLLVDNGIEPDIILYLETPPDKGTLTALLGKLDLNARQLLRKGEDAYKHNNLKNPALSDEQLIDFMTKYPKLIERPIVINGAKAALGRPPEAILDIL